MKITNLFIYPIKSLGGISKNSAAVGMKGLAFDRRWTLVGSDNVFLSQRTVPVLGNFIVEELETSFLVINKKTNNEIEIPKSPTVSDFEIIKIWDDEINALNMGAFFNDWFSKETGMEVRLFFQPEVSIRPIDVKYAVNKTEETSLSDGYPILIISQGSLNKLNELCPETMVMERFRPNIVIDEQTPHFEDELKGFSIGSVEFYGVKPCARCIVTTINPDDLVKTAEPLKTLSTYRKVGNKILFGQNVVVHKTGIIKIGDQLVLV
jgi:uncharacterized protein